MNIDDMIGKLNDPRLKQAIVELKASPKGKQLTKKLEQTDKSKLEGYLRNINNSKISSEMLLAQIKSNPDILDKLNALLSKM